MKRQIKVLLLVAVVLFANGVNAQECTITTVAGGGDIFPSWGREVSATEAHLSNHIPRLVIDDSDNLIFTMEEDGDNTLASIYKWTPAGIVEKLFISLIMAPSSRSLAVDRESNVFYVDSSAVHQILPSGDFLEIFRSLGLGALAIGSDGNFYFGEHAGDTIKKRMPDGSFVHIAGIGEPGYSGDGGLATLARLDGVSDLSMDRADNIYFLNRLPSSPGVYPHVIRRISSEGIITTVAGNLLATALGDGGPATSALINRGEGIGLDNEGNIYIAQGSSNRVRKVSEEGIITTIAGNGTSGFSGDGGRATEAQISNPTDVAVDSEGNVYIADSGNRRIRKITPCPPVADLSITKTVRTAQQGRSIRMGQNVYYVITVRNNGPETARNILIDDVLPSGVNFVSVAATSDPPFECGYTSSSRRVRCAVPSLPVGYNYQINLIVTPTRPGKVVNSASILSEVEDENQSNNNSSYSISVTGK